MNAIALLKADHQRAESLFRKFESLGDRAVVAKRNIMNAIVDELVAHAAIEEEVFYPSVRYEVVDLRNEVLGRLEEHHVVKWLLFELDHMSTDDERFAPKATVLMGTVRHHVREEEAAFFPLVRATLGRTRLGEIGESLEEAKAKAPILAHRPDGSPGNVICGVIGGPVDRLRSVVWEATTGADQTGRR